MPPMNALSGERFKLTDAQIRPQLKKAAEFCNTILPIATSLGCAANLVHLKHDLGNGDIAQCVLC